MSDSEASEVHSGAPSRSDWSSAESEEASDAGSQGSGSSEPGPKRKKVDLKVQLEVGEYALRIKNVSKAGRDYGFGRAFVQRCVKHVPKLQALRSQGVLGFSPLSFLSILSGVALKGRYRMPGAGRPAKAQALDKAVLDWIQKYQNDAQHPRRPSRSAILEEAARVWTRAGQPPPKEKWLKGFLKRSGVPV